MQTVSPLIRLILALSLLLGAGAHAQGADGQVSYTLVDRQGVEVSYAGSNPRKGILFRRTRPDGSFTDFRVPEFDTLVRKHNFEFELASDPPIISPQGDYFVVEAMRSIAMNPEEDADYVRHPLWWKHRCGHGVNLTYLVGVVKNKIRIVKKYLTACTSETRRIDSDGQLGFEVKGYGDDDTGKAVLYLLQKDGRFTRKVTGPYKENF